MLYATKKIPISLLHLVTVTESIICPPCVARGGREEVREGMRDDTVEVFIIIITTFVF